MHNSVDFKISLYYTIYMAKDIMAPFREWGKQGAKITNEKLTTEDRSRAAKKGWKKRKLVSE